VIRRTFLLVAALLVLLTSPAFARPGDGEGKAKKEWEKQRAEERKERQKKLRDAMRGKTPQEQEEILRKLKELERKAMRDRLREKRKQYEKFKERLLASLPAPVRARYGKLGKDVQRDVVLHSMRRVWDVGQKRFAESLTPEQRKELEGLSRREHWRKVMEILDHRTLEAQTLETRKELEALPEEERVKRIHTLRTKYVIAKFALIENEVVFPEAAALLKKSDAEIKKAVHRGRWSRDKRPHHRKGVRFPDRELHDLLHKLPEKLRKQYDDEFLRIVAKHRDPQSLKKALDELKAALRKALAD